MHRDIEVPQEGMDVLDSTLALLDEVMLAVRGARELAGETHQGDEFDRKTIVTAYLKLHNSRNKIQAELKNLNHYLHEYRTGLWKETQDEINTAIMNGKEK